EKSWMRFRTPDTSDADLRHLLAGEQVQSGATFGQLYQPRPEAEVAGALDVSGWALSPYGIRSVSVLVDAGRHRFDAPLLPRADVSARYPHYPLVPRPAFALVIPARPRGVGEATDVQIEIVDGR